MLMISKDQHLAISEQAATAFADRVADFLHQNFPASRTTARPALAREVMPLVAKSISYGLDTERDATAYVVTAAYLGRDFDIAVPQAKTILQRSELGGAAKARDLQALTLDILDRLKR